MFPEWRSYRLGRLWPKVLWRWRRVRHPGASAEDTRSLNSARGLGEGCKLRKWVRAKPHMDNASGESRRGFF